VSARTNGPGAVAAGALVIGGMLAVWLPRFGVSIVQLVIVTVAAAAALHTLAVGVPQWSATGWWLSPFDRTRAPGSERQGRGELDRIRARLSGRRQRVPGGDPMPPEVLRLLQPLIRFALERQGLDLRSEAHRSAARRLLSPLTWAVLEAEPLRQPYGLRTLWPNRRQVAASVHAVLDDLERTSLAPSDGAPRAASMHPTHP